jgi:hypothetical protein
MYGMLGGKGMRNAYKIFDRKPEGKDHVKAVDVEGGG